ncbi:unnamed protein product [Schistocephalus solidus]|uniref:Endo/exonuclease/phosphatase domain-containing protein n=1 Tax=Schistocephalus solidus TaxID=70667 RepID=A0A183TN35_SCHSO|nr:unnamed protein product [Schistocephalus solidus]
MYQLSGNDHEADAQLLDDLKIFAAWPNTRIVGNFNVPKIDWNSASVNCFETAVDQQFLCTTGNSLLTQHDFFLMRVREGQQMNCLDLGFTRSPDNIEVVNCVPL